MFTGKFDFVIVEWIYKNVFILYVNYHSSILLFIEYKNTNNKKTKIIHSQTNKQKTSSLIFPLLFSQIK